MSAVSGHGGLLVWRASATGSHVEDERHLVRLVVVELAQVGVQGGLVVEALGEVCPRPRLLQGCLPFLGAHIEFRADDLDASDGILHVVLVLV